MEAKTNLNPANVSQVIQDQVLPKVRKALDRRTVAQERLNLLKTRRKVLEEAKSTKEKERTAVEGRVVDVDDPGDPAELNRQACAIGEEIAGLEKAIDSLDAGGDAFLAAKKELEEAQQVLQRAFDQARREIQPAFDLEMNVFLERAHQIQTAWENAIRALQQELRVQGNEHYAFDRLSIDPKRSDFAFVGQFTR